MKLQEYRAQAISRVKGSVCFVLKFELPPFPLSPLWCEFQSKTGTEPLTQGFWAPLYYTFPSLYTWISYLVYYFNTLKIMANMRLVHLKCWSETETEVLGRPPQILL